MPTNPPTAPKKRNTTRHLNTNGITVQEHYLREALALLMRYGTLRLYSLAFGLFPLRAPSAALAAAQRVMANAVKCGYVAFADEPKSRRRYYALSAAGARHLREETDEIWAEATTHLLKKLTRAHHREWSNLCAIAAARRGLESYAESDFWGQAFRTDVTQNFGHVPDALTFLEVNNTPLVVWHEFELSRRSVRSRRRGPLAADEQDRSGVGKFRHLLHTLRAKRYITNGAVEHVVMLLLHCATVKIARELERMLRDYCSGNGVVLNGAEGVFRMPFMTKGAGSLEVRFNLLPSKGDIESVWHDTNDLPWQGAEAAVENYNEQFVVTRGARRPSHAAIHAQADAPVDGQQQTSSTTSAN